MTKKSGPRFDATRVTSIEWVIRDHAFSNNDPRSTIACVWKIDPGEYEVVWVRDLGLQRYYHSVDAVLDDIGASRLRAENPAPVPRRAPVAKLGAVS